MNARNNDINNFTAEDIRKYLSGKLTPVEMHAIEKAALEDPFLAEAIEGLSESIEKEGEFKVSSELEILKKEFGSRHHSTETSAVPAPVKKLLWWKPVAAAAVLLIGAFAAYNLLNTNSSDRRELAVTEKAEQPPAASAKTTTDSAVPATAKQEPQQQVPKKEDTAKELVQKKPVPGTPSPSPKRTDPAAVEMEKGLAANSRSGISRTTEAPAAIEPAKDTEEKSKKELPPNVAGLAIENLKPEIKRDLPVNRNNFIGQVTDPNKKPIASAVIQLQNSEKAYLTDNNGFFSIPSADTSVNVKVGSAGFETQTLKLNNTFASTFITLHPQPDALNEVVVTGYGRQYKRDNSARAREVIVQNAEPEGGRLAFESYVEKNKKLRSDSGTVEVVVSFSVNKTGRLSDFKIEKASSLPFNQEAIRLINEGPKWKLLKGRKTRATIMIRF
jgi:hypothetical protein